MLIAFGLVLIFEFFYGADACHSSLYGLVSTIL